MFQTFEVQTRPESGPPRLAALREAMAATGLQGWLVPRSDAFAGEYVAPCDEGLAWLTGFTGSAGFAVILPDIAGVFVDGRYRVQVGMQVADAFTPVDWPEVQAGDWIARHLEPSATVGFDPWLHSVSETEALEKRLSTAGIGLRGADNLVNAIWTDRPGRPQAPFFAWSDDLAGATSAQKRARIAEDLRKAGQDCAVITLPDSIAWLLNIRGADIPRNPVPQSFAILRADGSCDLFALPGKCAALDLGPDVRIHAETDFAPALAGLDGVVRIDPKTCPRAVVDLLPVTPVQGPDPCLLPKAIKTAAELSGARAAQLRDGVAMVEFLAWLDANAPGGDLTEIAVVQKLEGFRRATNALRDISFETICGAGDHGAIVHYRVTEATDRPVRPGELLLVDSGGQYLDGTTDITRTIAVGPVPDGAARAYTRVLQGVIALSSARFPRGVGGQHLDALARMALWSDGLDYDHGTGHGIGAYLSVHEGPAGLSRRSEVALEPGMILSIEPGYYRVGQWGIRIENLAALREAPALPGQDDRPWLDFETLTLVPLDRRLIETGLLTGPERDWINRYHADTLARISPRVEGATLDWLQAACAPL